MGLEVEGFAYSLQPLSSYLFFIIPHSSFIIYL